MGIVLLENHKNKLKLTIQNSTINDADKKMWVDFIEKVSDSEVHFLINALDNEDNIEYLTNNLKQKIDAINRGQISNLPEIVNDEKRYLAEQEK